MVACSHALRLDVVSGSRILGVRRQHSCTLGQVQAERSVGRAQWVHWAVVLAETWEVGVNVTESHAGEKRLASAFPRCWRPRGVRQRCVVFVH